MAYIRIVNILHSRHDPFHQILFPVRKCINIWVIQAFSKIRLRLSIVRNPQIMTIKRLYVPHRYI